MNHIVSNSFELTIWFSSWIFQEISIYRCNLMCLTWLNRNIVESLDNSFYSIPSINNCKVGYWIFLLLHGPKKFTVVSNRFLEYMLWCKYISRNSINSYQKSPLSFWSLLSEEGSIKNKNWGSVRGEGWIYTNIAPFLEASASVIFLWILESE